jgi:murein DD-endopeptidase MepM/ murein hydrolase activator NlpD
MMALFASLRVEAEIGTPPDASVLEPVPWTPVLMRLPDCPRAFQGSDGRYNLVYDIFLVNYNRNTAKLKQLKVLGNGQPVLVLKGNEMLKTFNTLDGNRDGELGPGSSGIFWINLSFDKRQDVPKELLHEITFDSPDALGREGTRDYTTLPLEVETAQPVVVAPPLKGGRWYALGGYVDHQGHRTALFPINNKLISAQRFAIDWMLLDINNHCYDGDGKKVADWFCYSKPVLAVGDGTVYGVLDKFPDQIPFKPSGTDRLSYPAGNCIILDLGNGYYGVYAHLKPGSIKVKAGDTVKCGQEIALVGNSGNTDGPHLHFHVVDAPGILTAHGVPYVFDKFRIEGEIADVDRSVKNYESGDPEAIKLSAFDGEHTQELPKSGALVVFPQ